jgi:hypothetical protein
MGKLTVVQQPIRDDIFECYYDSFWGDACYPTCVNENWMIKEDIKNFIMWLRGKQNNGKRKQTTTS